jgi:putative DNA primase/helicase
MSDDNINNIADEVEETKNKSTLAADSNKKKVGSEVDQKPKYTFEQLKAAYYHNEYGDADIAVPLFRNRFVRDNTTGIFYEFTKHRWHECKNREHEAAFREVADIYSHAAVECGKRAKEAEAGDDIDTAMREKKWQKNFNDRAWKLRGSARPASVLNKATAGPMSLGVSGENWNLNASLLPAANGVIDLETGKIRDGKYDDFFFHGSPIEYKGFNFGSSFVDNFISQLLCGHKELIEYFKLLIGFACTGIQTKDFFVMFGPLGNNGKSVLFDWISYVLGGFASAIPVEMIYEDRFGKDPDKPSPQLLNLRGLRLAVMSEPASNKRLSTSKLKFLTSGSDKIAARNLNEKKIISFWPTHTLIMHGNEVPRVVGHQGPFYDRLNLIPFRARFTRDDSEVDEANHIYKQLPRAEMDALLRQHDSEMLSFLVRCAKKALALGDMPSAPDIVKDETAAFRDEEDLVGRFLKICTAPNILWEEPAKEIYASFTYYCHEELGLNSKQTPSQKAIAADLRAQPHIERIQGRTISYKGLKIVDEWRAPADFR